MDWVSLEIGEWGDRSITSSVAVLRQSCQELRSLKRETRRQKKQEDIAVGSHILGWMIKNSGNQLVSENTYTANFWICVKLLLSASGNLIVCRWIFGD